tara:strand:+ start:514 stop:900 length:387 start_codon:yes stop_codon:yes gene_type:complete
MSRKQWGHGYYVGKGGNGKKDYMKKLREEKSFPTGYFFIKTDEKGEPIRHGIVEKVEKNIVLVKYFSCLDGHLMSEIFTLKKEDLETDYCWYDSDDSMAEDFIKKQGFTEGMWEYKAAMNTREFYKKL